MPIPVQPNDHVTWEQLAEICKIVGPLLAVIIGLIIASWKSMEKTHEKLEQALTNSVEVNDKEHDRIFTDIRATDSKLDHLSGEHDARKNICQNCEAAKLIQRAPEHQEHTNT